MKRFISVLVSLLLLSASSAGYAADTSAQLQLGDYIILGKYEGKPIIWRYVADDENGKLFLSDDILCYKEFDENSYDREEYIPQRDSSHNRRLTLEKIHFVMSARRSGYWGDSNIRSWLQSDEEEVTWLCGVPPKNESYRDECGFLHNKNFTQFEKYAIKTVELNTEVHPLADGNIYPYSRTVNIFNLPRFDIKQTETVFLIDENQMNIIKNNSDVLGEYLPLNYSDTDFKIGDWFLRDPGTDIGNDDHYGDSRYGGSVIYMEDNRDINYWCMNIIPDVEKGIRPAFYLNEDVAEIISGDGTKENPYVIDGRKDYVPDITVSVFGNILSLEQPIMSDNGRILIPFSALADAWKAETDLDMENNEVIFAKYYTNTNDSTIIKLNMGSLKADADWDIKNSIVAAERQEVNDNDQNKEIGNSTVISLEIDSNVMIKNNESIYIDSPPMVVNGQILLPLRAVAEAIGCNVRWDSEMRRAVVNY